MDETKLKDFEGAMQITFKESARQITIFEGDVHITFKQICLSR